MCDWTGSLPVLVNMPLQADYDVTSIMAAGVQRLNDAVDDDNIYQLDMAMTTCTSWDKMLFTLSTTLKRYRHGRISYRLWLTWQNLSRLLHRIKCSSFSVLHTNDIVFHARLVASIRSLNVFLAIYQLDRDEDDNVADLKIFIKACFGLDA